ncbi:hypothetical protein CEXT_269971 [Caerostris extrusa]|uniref:Uncharacterized protein n=1 Tax=Caerostris extrusa TaxID=172846 RepID=A0AAV4P3J0_CAEEX|nr:hypothetical protein CEXT_269971 [Caerostris extrusa]
MGLFAAAEGSYLESKPGIFAGGDKVFQSGFSPALVNSKDTTALGKRQEKSLRISLPREIIVPLRIVAEEIASGALFSFQAHFI